MDWGGPSTIDRIDDLLAARRRRGQRVGVLGPLRFSDQHRLAGSVGELVGLDRAYQRLRALVNDPGLRDAFARLPIEARRRLAAEARAGSREHLAQAADYITDVNGTAVGKVFEANGQANEDATDVRRPQRTSTLALLRQLIERRASVR